MNYETYNKSKTFVLTIFFGGFWLAELIYAPNSWVYFFMILVTVRMMAPIFKN